MPDKLTPTSEPGVYRRQNSTGRVSYVAVVSLGRDERGKPRQERRTFPSFELAKTHKTRVEYERRAGEYLAPSRELFGVFLDGFLDRQRGHVKPASVRSYRDHAKRLGPLRDVPLRDLTPVRIASWVKGLHDAKLSGNTVMQTFALVKRVLAEAVRFRLIPVNPCAAVRTPTAPKPTPRYLDTEQLAAFRRAIVKDDLRAWWETAIETGMRFGELASLRWGAVDLAAGAIDVVETVTRDEAGAKITGPPKSDAGRRRILISPALVALLTAHRATVAPTVDDLVFPGPNGARQHNNVVNNRLAKLCLAAKVPVISMHGLRHTNGSRATAAGIPASTLAERLGHQHATTTISLYVHPDRADHEAARDRLAAFLAPPNDGAMTEPGMMSQEARSDEQRKQS